MIKRSYFFILIFLAHNTFAADKDWILYGIGGITSIAVLLGVDYYTYNIAGKLIDRTQKVPYYDTNRYAEEITSENKEFATIIDDVVSSYYKDKNSEILLRAIDSLSAGCNALKSITNQHLESTPCRIKIFEAESLLKTYKENQNKK